MPSPELILKVRILHEGVFAFGPGKAALLDAIGRLESITAAGRALGLSYSKTRRLVDEMNRSFRTPLVTTTKGGAHQGGAQVTPTGWRVLAAFRAMEAQAEQAVQESLGELLAELA